jgi:hypothetical protein
MRARCVPENRLVTSETYRMNSGDVGNNMTDCETKWWNESRELRAQLSGHERQLLPQPHEYDIDASRDYKTEPRICGDGIKENAHNMIHLYNTFTFVDHIRNYDIKSLKTEFLLNIT